jgi:Flp pilus assembly protein TadG
MIAVSPTRKRSQRGNAMLEGALSIWVFVMLMLGLMEFSMAVYAYNFVTYAANEAARYASLHGANASPAVTSTQITQRVQKQAAALLASRLTVEVWGGNGTQSNANLWPTGNQPGNVATVKVSYSVVPMAKIVFKSAITVTSTSKMTISN